MKNIIAFTLLITFFLASCHSNKEITENMDTKTSMTEKYWKLKTLYGAAVNMTPNQEREAFLRFTTDGKVEGFTGCNSMNGDYKIENGLQISFSKIASTKMMCAPGINENKFLEAINTADNFSISKDGKTLSLNKARMAPLAVFELADEKVASQSTFDLAKEKKAVTEKYWKLETLRGKKVTMVDNQEREAFFRLTSTGRLTGFSGCNAISGGYNLQEGFRINFEKVAVSMKMCAGVDERGFLDVLNDADNYSLSNNDESLSLNKARMAPLATFKAVYFK